MSRATPLSPPALHSGGAPAVLQMAVVAKLLAKVARPMSRKLSPTGELGELRSCPRASQKLPNSWENAPGAELWPNFDQRCPTIAKSGQGLANFDKHWPDGGQLWAKLDSASPNSAERWQLWPELAEGWPEFAELSVTSRTHSVEFGPELGARCICSTIVGQLLENTEARWARRWGKLSQTCGEQPLGHLSGNFILSAAPARPLQGRRQSQGRVGTDFGAAAGALSTGDPSFERGRPERPTTRGCPSHEVYDRLKQQKQATAAVNKAKAAIRAAQGGAL